MKLPFCIAMALLAGCAAKKPVVPEPGPETVHVSTAHPGLGFVALGPVTGLDGSGCGEDGKRGRHDAAVASLMRNAFAMGATHVQVTALYEPRQMNGCFVNLYRVSGTAYRDGKVATSSATVESLRELQRLREAGVINQQEFEKLKAKIID
jgi:hypothetical protein